MTAEIEKEKLDHGFISRGPFQHDAKDVLLQSPISYRMNTFLKLTWNKQIQYILSFLGTFDTVSL